MKRSMMWVAAALSLCVVPAVAIADGFRDGGVYGHMWGGGGYPGMFFGPFFGLLVLIALVVGLVMLARCWGGRCHHHGRRGGGSAQDILRDRFARGEIDAADYQERKRILEED